MIPLKWRFRALGILLIAVALLPALNGAIYFSSTPRQHQMGWAIFCAANGIWILTLGLLTLVYADSHEVAMRQLDRDAEYEAAKT